MVFVCFWSTRLRVISPLSSSTFKMRIMVGLDNFVMNAKVSIVMKVSPRSHLNPCHHCLLWLALSNKVKNTTTTLGSPQCCQSIILRCILINPLFAVSFAISQPFAYLGVVSINQLTNSLEIAHIRFFKKEGDASGDHRPQQKHNLQLYDTSPLECLCP